MKSSFISYPRKKMRRPERIILALGHGKKTIESFRVVARTRGRSSKGRGGKGRKRMALKRKRERGRRERRCSAATARERRARKSDGRIGRKQERGASVRDGGARSKVWQKSQMSLDLLARQLPETSGIPKMVPPRAPWVSFNAPAATSRRTSVSPAGEGENERRGPPRTPRDAVGLLANFHF